MSDRNLGLQYKNSNLLLRRQKLESIAKKIGTPCYVYDLDGISEAVTEHIQVFDGKADIHYAVKANSHPLILKRMKQLGIGADVVSGGELLWALKCGFKPQDIIYSGVAKSKEELTLALKKKIKLINVESVGELERIFQIAKKLKLKARVGVRFNPDVNAETHPYITTGFRENKFGLDGDMLEDFVRLAKKQSQWVDVAGISLHIGSQLKDLSALREAIQKAIPVYKSLKSHGLSMDYFDVGGGVAIEYFEGGERPQTLKDYGTMVREVLKDLQVKILCEPGRILVGPYGVLLTEVEYLKKTKWREFVIVNTGMHHLIRPALYEAYHRILPLKLDHAREKKTYDIVGPICESSDFLAKERTLQEVKQGEFLAICEAGAYGYSMASVYNLHAPPHEVVIDKNKIHSKKVPELGARVLI